MKAVTKKTLSGLGVMGAMGIIVGVMPWGEAERRLEMAQENVAVERVEERASGDFGGAIVLGEGQWAQALALSGPLAGARIEELRELGGGEIEAKVWHANWARPLYVRGERGAEGLEVTESAIFDEFLMATESLVGELGHSVVNGQYGELTDSNEILSRLRAQVETLAERQGHLEMALAAGLEIEANALVYPAAMPNDPNYASDWSQRIVDMEAVWEQYGFDPGAVTGYQPVVAIVDSGVSVSSGDFDLWVNPNEVAGDGIDNDGNGYVDDINGVNIINPAAGLSWTGTHGTTVGRIAAQVANNGVGGASIASRAKMMNVLATGDSGGSLWDITAGIYYAAGAGADVINVSVVSTSPTAWSLAARHAENHGALMVVAAGNDNKELMNGVVRYPACTDHPNIIVVGASNSADGRATSNYSATIVDVFAPGSVTSWATPVVSSLVGLLRAVKPEASLQEIKAAVIAGAEPSAALNGLCVAGGRVSAAGSVAYLTGTDIGEVEPPVIPEAPVLTAVLEGVDAVRASWTVVSAANQYELVAMVNGGAEQVIYEGVMTEAMVENLPAGSQVSVKVRVEVNGVYSAWSAVQTAETPVIETPEAPGLTAPVHFWEFDEDTGLLANDRISGNYNWQLENVEWILTEQGSYLGFGLGSRAAISDRSSVNGGTITDYTLAFWFNPSRWSLTGNRMLYEQGGTTRGLNLYLENGELWVGGWNAPTNESGWAGTWLSGGTLVANEWVHVAMTLNGGVDVQAEAMKLYINGALVAAGEGSQLWSHLDNIGMGFVNEATLTPGNLSFEPEVIGAFESFGIWHAALSGAEIGEWMAGTAPWPTVSRENVVASEETVEEVSEETVVMVPAVHDWDFAEVENGIVSDSVAGVGMSVVGMAQVMDAEGRVIGVDFSGQRTAIANQASINGGSLLESYSIAMELYIEEAPQGRVVLWEQGGTLRGLNIGIEDGRVFAGGWNVPESGWEGTWLKSDAQLAAGQWHSVLVTLNAGKSLTDAALCLYVNGSLVATGAGSAIWKHTDGIGIGGVTQMSLHQGEEISDSAAATVIFRRLLVWNQAVEWTAVDAALGTTLAQTGSSSADETVDSGAEESVVPSALDTATHYYDFAAVTNNTIADSLGSTLSLVVKNAELASVADGSALPYFGNGAVATLPDSATVNNQNLETYSIGLWICAEAASQTGEVMVYEQGGATRGLNIRLSDGRFVAEGWNLPSNESDWRGTMLVGSELVVGQWHHVAVVLDAAAATFSLYVDGALADSGYGAKIYKHLDDTGIGQVAQETVVNGQAVRSVQSFEGWLTGLMVSNRACDAAELAEVYRNN